MQQVRNARAGLIESASAGLADASVVAVNALRGLLAAESESVRLGAAKSVLELACRFRDAAELENRLANLEERIREFTDDKAD